MTDNVIPIYSDPPIEERFHWALMDVILSNEFDDVGFATMVGVLEMVKIEIVELMKE